MAAARRLEFVVNSIGKDKIAGYLSVPSGGVQRTRRPPETKPTVAAIPWRVGGKRNKRASAAADALSFFSGLIPLC